MDPEPDQDVNADPDPASFASDRQDFNKQIIWGVDPDQDPRIHASD
jgi:hypothetical protein